MYAMDRLDTAKLNPGNRLAPRLFADSLMELSANRPYFLSPRYGRGRRLGQLQVSVSVCVYITAPHKRMRRKVC